MESARGLGSIGGGGGGDRERERERDTRWPGEREREDRVRSRRGGGGSSSTSVRRFMSNGRPKCDDPNSGLVEILMHPSAGRILPPGEK